MAPLSLQDLTLVDGHCHSVFTGPVDDARFELAATEGDHPARDGVSYLHGAVGLAIRRWCAPVLDLPTTAPMTGYLARRHQLGEDETARRLMTGAGLSLLLVDTGLAGPDMAGPDLAGIHQLAGLASAEAREVVRLETVAEDLAHTGTTAPSFASSYIDALAAATREAVAVKSILAYRHGFAVDPDRPSAGDVQNAADQWLARPGSPRLDHPVLLRFLLWCAIDRGLPIQMHTGFGDRDLMLPSADPSLLHGFLTAAEPSGVPIVLLHCYPYHRQAGWLAQVFPNVYVDVGLTVAQVGARADAVLAEYFELAPFDKVLFSTDAYALPELYLIGAAQFRHSLAKLLNDWVADGALSRTDGERLAVAVGSANARRVYRL